MIEPIDKEKSAISPVNPSSSSSKHTSRGSSSGSASQGQISSKHKSQTTPARIKEEDGEEDRVGFSSRLNKPTYFLSPSQSLLASSSPGELSPSEEAKVVAAAARGQRKTDPTRPTVQPVNNKGMDLAATAQRAQTLDPKAGQPSYFPPVPIAATSASPEPETEKQQILGGSTRQQQLGDDGVLRKDTVLSPDEKEERKQEHRDELEEPQEFAPEGWGQSFNIQWIKVGSLPFGRTRHLRNPWNADREVKVSRDGTEVEPSERSLFYPSADTDFPSRWMPDHGGMGQSHGGAQQSTRTVLHPSIADTTTLGAMSAYILSFPGMAQSTRTDKLNYTWSKFACPLFSQHCMITLIDCFIFLGIHAHVYMDGA